jgi:hypothetical protein
MSACLVPTGRQGRLMRIALLFKNRLLFLLTPNNDPKGGQITVTNDTR